MPWRHADGQLLPVKLGFLQKELLLIVSGVRAKGLQNQARHRPEVTYISCGKNGTVLPRCGGEERIGNL